MSMISKTPPKLWSGQSLHFVSLSILLVFVLVSWLHLKQPNQLLFWIAVAVLVLHQIYVWITWRLELATKATSRTIGFRGYLTGFFILFIGRFITLLFLVWFDRGSLDLSLSAQVMGGISLAIPGFYAMYSVRAYFGIARAAGADHFDEHYRKMPLVKEGIFKFTSNGMYLYAFLLFWTIAIGFNSASAIVVAAFSHAYIWVHYHATEKPDMDYLYS